MSEITKCLKCGAEHQPHPDPFVCRHCGWQEDPEATKKLARGRQRARLMHELNRLSSPATSLEHGTRSSTDQLRIRVAKLEAAMALLPAVLTEVLDRLDAIEVAHQKVADVVLNDVLARLDDALTRLEKL